MNFDRLADILLETDQGSGMMGDEYVGEEAAETWLMNLDDDQFVTVLNDANVHILPPDTKPGFGGGPEEWDIFNEEEKERIRQVYINYHGEEFPEAEDRVPPCPQCGNEVTHPIEKNPGWIRCDNPQCKHAYPDDRRNRNESLAEGETSGDFHPQYDEWLQKWYQFCGDTEGHPECEEIQDVLDRDLPDAAHFVLVDDADLIRTFLNVSRKLDGSLGNFIRRFQHEVMGWHNKLTDETGIDDISGEHGREQEPYVSDTPVSVGLQDDLH